MKPNLPSIDQRHFGLPSNEKCDVCGSVYWELLHGSTIEKMKEL